MKHWFLALLLLLSGAAQAQPIIGLGTTPLTSAWMQNDKAFVLNNIPVDLPGLSINLLAGHTYSFRVELFYTDTGTGNNGGIQVVMNGDVIPASIIYEGWQFESNSVLGQGQQTALGGAVAAGASSATSGHAQIVGTIMVATAGALTVQAAQYSANSIPTVVTRGSFFIATDMP